MIEEKILTLHPQGKSGRNIILATYNMHKNPILSSLADSELTHNDLLSLVNQKLAGEFSGNIGWYAETVKLDLEARNIFERTNTKPQKYRLSKTI